MNYGEAFDKLVTGRCKGMRLPAWKEDVIIRLQEPTARTKMTAPYLYVESRFGDVPWMPNNIEMFSGRWILI